MTVGTNLKTMAWKLMRHYATLDDAGCLRRLMPADAVPDQGGIDALLAELTDSPELLAALDSDESRAFDHGTLGRDARERLTARLALDGTGRGRCCCTASAPAAAGPAAPRPAPSRTPPARPISENWYAKAALELGIPGLLAIAVALGALLWSLVRSLRRMDAGSRRLAAPLCALLLVTAVALFKGPYIDLDPMNVYFWLLAGVVAGIARCSMAAGGQDAEGGAA